MDKKSIAAIVVVIIIIVAAAAAYVGLSGGNDNGNDNNNPHALVLDGIEATEDNVLNGTYEIQRNLVLATLGEPTGNVKLFLDWITSSEGQAILSEEFVPLEDQNPVPAAPDRNGDCDITMSGSTSLTETMTKLAEEYMNKYDYINISVGTGGSGVGEQQAAEGTVDIGMLSRDVGADYQDVLVSHNIGKDGVAVVANINGVDEISMDDVAAIFSGEITNWNQIGGPDETIRVVIRESSSVTRECFENAMKNVDPEWTVTSNATSYNSTGGVIGQVQTLYGAIGYISIGQVKNLNPQEVSGPHAVELDGIEATEANVLNGTYEIQRNLVLATKGEPTGNVALFLDWITSSEGQAILSEEFVPLEDQNPVPAAPDRNGDCDITMSGSTSLTETMTKLAEEYMRQYNYIHISVGTGGSGVGEQQAAEGTVDIGMLSRDVGADYQDVLVSHNIGKDGVAVVCNISGVTELTMDEVAKIFSGEITNWSEVGGPDETIRVVIRESSSGTRECFENAMKNVDPDWTVTEMASSFNSTGGVIGQIQSLEGSIGYISIGQVANL